MPVDDDPIGVTQVLGIPNIIGMKLTYPSGPRRVEDESVFAMSFAGRNCVSRRESPMADC